MKIPLTIFLLCCFILMVNCRSNQEAEEITVEFIDSLLNKGFTDYQNEPLSALKNFRRAGTAYESIDSFNKAGNVYLNVAGIHEEFTHNLDSALLFSKKSLDNYLFGSDSMQIANVRKYYGYLLGINGNVIQGRSYIDQAKSYYLRLGFEEGIAVCNYNLARLAFLQGSYMKADSLTNVAIKVWDSDGNVDRLSQLNSLKLEIARESSNMVAPKE